jgi:hypothetical protein
MRPQKLAVGGVLFLCTLAAWTQTARDTPSTPEERQRAVRLTRKLEQTPLGPEASEDRDWLNKWIIEIPDLTVPVCDELLKPLLAGEGSQYRYSKELVSQQLAGEMAYLIEHPQEAKPESQDDFAINKAGMESALNAYDAIVKSGAKGARWGPLEEMAKKRKAGQLDDFVRSATLKCLTGETVTASLRFHPSTRKDGACWEPRLPACVVVQGHIR